MHEHIMQQTTISHLMFPSFHSFYHKERMHLDQTRSKQTF